MQTRQPSSSHAIRPALLLPAAIAALLSACGGTPGQDNAAAGTQVAAMVATSTTTLELDNPTLPAAAANLIVQPAYHIAPVLLDAPDDTDADGYAASARRGPRTMLLPPSARRLSTRRLSLDKLEYAPPQSPDSTLAPMATSGTVTTYTPAQIRAAYGLPALPPSGTTLTAALAAQLGAGQTIYIVDAMHNPNVAAELAAFNAKFGLPACTQKSIAPSAVLPLAAPSATGCDLSVVFNTSAGAMTATQPAYDSGWATEISLDVQWAHATAPLARIVLIEAASASVDNLQGAVKLANAMGPGVVSMSFGTPEGSWTSSANAAFTASNMTYLAATGDSGASVQWPAVSPNVVAVGGTSLTYTGSGSRSEVGWTQTGGGISAYTATPTYQTSSVPGLGTLAHRGVADVSFNADPKTGQYVAIIASGATTPSWISAGGTSLSTPQWAGLIAVANATRALNAKPALGAPHAVLYGQIASVPGTYASAFGDVISGSDGTCTTCSAKSGYDQLSGLGTPNAGSLLSALSGATAVASAPTVVPAAISGKVGTALSFTVSASGANPLSYTLSGAPSGMSIGSTGVVSWATPVAGTYAVVVTATDTKTGLKGQGTYTVTIAAASAPVVTGASITGKVGTALWFAVAVSSPNPVTYALSGAPAGMAISSSGVVSWAAPVAGSYSVTVTAKDSKTGLTGQAVFKISIGTSTTVSSSLTVNAPALAGVAGKPLAGTIGISAPGSSYVSISISGVPLGVTFVPNGLNIGVNWASPVTGSYTMKIVVSDSAGHSVQTNMAITIKAS
ncbi:S53 family peptidase [Duganella sp. LX20W]|uniref:S53 family peptidase n=1 Tax=Rugamonas brunnea TaxID=2758569 RepID=A0A7W2EU22_9BURK|nr:S53 family peptidase [Rugamonas brunnea]MBA5638633.1 S53 family peptidase [Rugamonas brunnea]